MAPHRLWYGALFVVVFDYKSVRDVRCLREVHMIHNIALPEVAIVAGTDLVKTALSHILVLDSVLAVCRNLGASSRARLIPRQMILRNPFWPTANRSAPNCLLRRFLSIVVAARFLRRVAAHLVRLARQAECAQRYCGARGSWRASGPFLSSQHLSLAPACYPRKIAARWRSFCVATVQEE